MVANKQDLRLALQQHQRWRNKSGENSLLSAALPIIGCSAATTIKLTCFYTACHPATKQQTRQQTGC
jgi:hypothetical protein